MRVATVQFEPGPDADANVEAAVDRVREAARRGADLVVLPEVWNVGYFAFDAYEAGAEPLDGPTVTRLRDLAADLCVYLHTGSVVEADGEDRYNASALVSPDGELLDVYRKVHLFGYDSEERRLLTPGDRVVAVDTDLGTVGLTTCYDLRFPELYRALVDEGAELLLVASAWPDARVEHWQLLTRTRAVESQAFLVAANLAGTNAGVDLAGRSVVVDPWGVPRLDAGVGERVALADVDLSEVGAVREEFPALDDRRLDADYSP
ncbi:MAG: carbon-nitrogen family hydrolase [Halobacteriaceae archaeon]